MDESGMKVLDHGFIGLEDVWGDEATIINTARVSHTNNRIRSAEDMTEKDTLLLQELLDKQHGTPFEAVYFRFRVIMPIFVARQWVKHRISTWNEYSQRYRKPIDAFYLPDEEGRQVDGFEVLTDSDIKECDGLMQGAYETYNIMLNRAYDRIRAAEQSGFIPTVTGGRNPYRSRARELLRNIIPVAGYTDVYWVVNFRSLMNFFDLRMDDNAQYEIQQYANLAFDLVEKERPLLAEAYLRRDFTKGR